MRLHRSRGDSGQGEAERTNSAIGDAVVDGATINWEVYKKFEEMNEEEINQLSVKEFEELEEQRMEKNAWYVAKTLVERIDGAPVLSERIKAYLTENRQEQ
ncbi:Transient receptor potential cation channel subfamily A member 1 [Paramuricea clavata]|uniref:Transient receptor potential cation channel subfamily A member 1 n=1 Tax=Paramuricea clavata TaxID=317549 RepID=A0A7D9EJX5_PARCT|nr:Transient receptor potential cation channel subfamily A member 1 [Paramuricea clavata]